MKHRYGSRFPINLDIKVKKVGLQADFYHTLDIGIGGALIDASDADFMEGNIVQTEIELHKADSAIRFTSKAQIIYTCNDGVGIRWSDEDEKIFLPLYEIILSTKCDTAVA